MAREDLNLSQTLDIFQLLTLTYSRYVDAPSREAVEAVGVELVRRDELRGTPEGEPDDERMGVAEQIVGWLSQEIDRMAKRPKCVLLPFIRRKTYILHFLQCIPASRHARPTELVYGHLLCVCGAQPALRVVRNMGPSPR